MKDMQIRFSDESRDYSNWMREKCGNILWALCCMLRENSDVGDSDSFYTALSNSITIYAFCCESLNDISCKHVRALLLKYNIEGYNFLQDLINGTRTSSFMREAFGDERDEEILTLIEQNDKTNRTKIAASLARITSSNRWVEEIRNDIELVHNGEKSWDWFYARHCNDRSPSYQPFSDDLIREVYEYFQSEDYESADSFTLK